MELYHKLQGLTREEVAAKRTTNTVVFIIAVACNYSSGVLRRNPDIDPSIGLLVIIVVLVGVIVAARAAYSLNILKGMNRKESTWFAILATFICFPLWLVILASRQDAYFYAGEEHTGERPEDQMNAPGVEQVSYLTIVR